MVTEERKDNIDLMLEKRKQDYISELRRHCKKIIYDIDAGIYKPEWKGHWLEWMKDCNELATNDLAAKHGKPFSVAKYKIHNAIKKAYYWVKHDFPNLFRSITN